MDDGRSMRAVKSSKGPRFWEGVEKRGHNWRALSKERGRERPGALFARRTRTRRREEKMPSSKLPPQIEFVRVENNSLVISTR